MRSMAAGGCEPRGAVTLLRCQLFFAWTSQRWLEARSVHRCLYVASYTAVGLYEVAGGCCGIVNKPCHALLHGTHRLLTKQNLLQCAGFLHLSSLPEAYGRSAARQSF